MNDKSRTAHHRMMIRDFRKRFFFSLAVTIPILLLSPLFQDIIGFTFTFPGSSYVLFGLSTFVFFYGGWPFLKGLVDELRKKSPGMMTLIGLAIGVAYLYSSAVVFGLEGRYFFWELATLVVVMLAGHWIEMGSVLSASKSLEELAKLMPDTAHKKEGDTFKDVSLEVVSSGDVLQIRPGEKVPTDGTILSGTSSINESMLTGESKPVEKSEEDEVIGGSINGEGALEIEVKNTGEESYLSKVITMVRESQEAKSRTQGIADKAAFWLTLIAITVGIVTLITWIIAGRDLQFSIERMATVMVITCPHALGLAIPLVVAVSTSKSAQKGLLIRNRTAFEQSRNIDVLLFDKTGTLTMGSFSVTGVKSFSETYDEKEILSLAGGLESSSEHPIGRGIVKKMEDQGLEGKDFSDFEAIKGKGVTGKLQGQHISVVSPGYVREQEIPLPEEWKEQPGVTSVFLLIENDVAGILELSDEIRSESYEAVKRLKAMGIECWMITGDNEETAKAVSEELGMDGYFAEVLPEEKQNKVVELQNRGKTVAMTGDGVNDAPALAKADIGIALGSGTDVAAETADIILVNSNPLDVTGLVAFGRATYRKMVQNLIWATGYNVIAIPLAAGALYWAGILISPAVGALLMSLSTVIVAINAQFLKPEREGTT